MRVEFLFFHCVLQNWPLDTSSLLYLLTELSRS
jgi:hypothetical protein